MKVSLDAVCAEISAETRFTSADFPPIRKILLYDELLNQMGRLKLRYMAFSYKIGELAVRLNALHLELIGDEARMAGFRQRAHDLVETT